MTSIREFHAGARVRSILVACDMGPLDMGGGYFITVKHGVLVLNDASGGRRIASVKIVHGGKESSATVIDSGTADVEVHHGDWAILKVRREIDLPALRAARVIRESVPRTEQLESPITKD